MKIYGMIAMGHDIQAYHAANKHVAENYCTEIERLKRYLETADIPDEIADAIEDAMDALESKYFAAAREFAEFIRQEPAYQEFLKTWQPPVF